MLPQPSASPALAQVDVVIVAYGAEEYLRDALDAVLASEGVVVEVCVIDNGCTRGDLGALTARPGVSLLSPGSNLGFAAGCGVGLSGGVNEYVAFVNSDAVIHPHTLAQLVAACTPEVGLTTACILLADQPEVVNSAGNPVHFLGASWAGGFGDPESAHELTRDVASCSGATALLRRALWDELGGFDPEFFMYCEDLDLSLRIRERGLRVRYVPTARVYHHYEFSRNPEKWYYLERNRLLVVFTHYESRTLLLLAPALLVFELAMLAAAALERRLGSKFRGYAWLLTHRSHLSARRRLIQAERRCADGDLALLHVGRILTPAAPGPAVRLVNAILAPYWGLVRHLLTPRRRPGSLHPPVART